MSRTRKTLVLALALFLLAALPAVVSAQGDMTPSVTVEDQVVKDGIVIVAEVVAAQDGWIVIHADADEGFGPPIGHAQVTAGVNQNVEVEIDLAQATANLFAMLHVDEGEMGVYEFPGPDGPVVMDGKPLAPKFNAIYVGRAQTAAEEAPAAAEGGEQAAAAQEVTPSVTVGDQDVVNSMVTVAEVVAAQDGWIVIHAQQDGGIGPVIGHAPVMAGVNTDVQVTVDTLKVTEVLYAMLHVDEGFAGVYQFPGPDGPVVVDGAPLAPAFTVTNYSALAPVAAPEQAAGEQAAGEQAAGEQAAGEQAAGEQAAGEQATGGEAGATEMAPPEVLPVTGGSFPEEKGNASLPWAVSAVVVLLLAGGVFVYRRRVA